MKAIIEGAGLTSKDRRTHDGKYVAVSLVDQDYNGGNDFGIQTPPQTKKKTRVRSNKNKLRYSDRKNTKNNNNNTTTTITNMIYSNGVDNDDDDDNEQEWVERGRSLLVTIESDRQGRIFRHFVNGLGNSLKRTIVPLIIVSIVVMSAQLDWFYRGSTLSTLQSKFDVNNTNSNSNTSSIDDYNNTISMKHHKQEDIVTNETTNNDEKVSSRLSKSSKNSNQLSSSTTSTTSADRTKHDEKKQESKLRIKDSSKQDKKIHKEKKNNNTNTNSKTLQVGPETVTKDNDPTRKKKNHYNYNHSNGKLSTPQQHQQFKSDNRKQHNR